MSGGGLGIGGNWMSFGGAKISECSSMSPDELHAGLGGVVSEEGKPAKGMGDDGILQVALFLRCVSNLTNFLLH